METKFAIFTAAYSPAREDHGVRREWVMSVNNGIPAMTRHFERAKVMDITEAVSVYKQIDSPLKKIGIVPVE